MSDKPAALDPELLARASQRAFPDRQEDARRLALDVREEQRLAAEDASMEEFAPFVVTFTESGLTFRTGVALHSEAVVAVRGMEIEVTPEIYRASFDSSGRSWLTFDEDQQRANFGKVCFHRGPWNDADGPKHERDSQEWYTAHREALRQARVIESPGARALALQQVADTYGVEPQHGTYAGGSP
jgi:hypothetical protein